ncbi:MAG: hypothetical protein B7X94_05670 [Hydrogenophilales bacterium 17-62-8]|nr:MAG: hypothetical protein B7X94_05670 [Hydrogenophilales bacterium 17-62-8]
MGIQQGVLDLPVNVQAGMAAFDGCDGTEFPMPGMDGFCVRGPSPGGLEYSVCPRAGMAQSN